MAVADIPAELIVNNRTSFEQFLWRLPTPNELYRWDASIVYMYAYGATPVEGQGLPPKPPLPNPGSPFTPGEAAWLNALYVRTINGVGPDANGDVQVAGGGGDGVDQYARDQAELANSVAQAKYTKPSGGIPEADLVASIVSKLAAGASAYQKPSGGIPKTDLATTVGTSLGKADTAYQKPSGGIPTTDFTTSVQQAIALAATSVQQGDLGAYAKSVNGYTPDASGNITVPTGGGGGGGGVDSVNGRLGAVTLTSSDVGLDQVNNTSDADKPLSTAATAALAQRVQTVNGIGPDADGNVAVETGTGGVTSVNTRSGDVTLAKSDVGLDQVDNTSDTNKPVSTAQAAAIGGKYTKPAAGIPTSDLNATAQSQLGKAGSAVQSVAGKSPDGNGAVSLLPADVGAAPTSHTHTVSQVSDMTSTGRGVATATTAAAARSVLGAGTGNGTVTKVNGVSPDGNGALVLPSVANYDSLQDIRYVAYGHSFGQQQSPWNTTAAGVYPERVADDLQIDRSNYANRTSSGARAANMLATIQSTWKRGDYGLVTLMITQNDAGYRTSMTSFKASLTAAIDYLRGPAEFAPTIVVILDTYDTAAGYARYPTPLTDAVMDQYNQYVKDVVATYPTDGSIILADANAGWDPSTMAAFDGQHPNDRGSAFIAAAVLKALANAPFREGQNYGITQPSYFYDSFNRANSTSIGGPAYSAASPYTTYNASGSSVTYGIANNQAYRSDSGTTVGESCCVYDSGSGSADVQMVMATLGTKGAGPAWRAADGANMWVLDIFGTGAGNGKVYKKVSNTFTQVGSALSIEVKSGDTVRVTHNLSGIIRVYVNGTQAFTATDNAMSGNTKHGFRIVSNNGLEVVRIDDLIVK